MSRFYVRSQGCVGYLKETAILLFSMQCVGFGKLSPQYIVSGRVIRYLRILFLFKIMFSTIIRIFLLISMVVRILVLFQGYSQR
ncbi:hypothetical protein RchiOBHm_Chr4g0391691 [Rosa chinensis]|uniref:Uncharacterized protein n=1 Tax=Rosa chinensis TaxID=74649 RepID=A0A2P6QQJ9_ROSCH|nr:hypothetical protein RchiOBHm_Chr4g0391691 [Rosa chinensis]